MGAAWAAHAFARQVGREVCVTYGSELRMVLNLHHRAAKIELTARSVAAVKMASAFATRDGLASIVPQRCCAHKAATAPVGGARQAFVSADMVSEAMRVRNSSVHMIAGAMVAASGAHAAASQAGLASSVEKLIRASTLQQRRTQPLARQHQSPS
mmetsp:Transcript_47999/g.114084  ORF Transcript_47999/g.114084 Transcript_47999/m.114084 type:complete len:155 (-) Transcript_47999:2154-2618(-)